LLEAVGVRWVGWDLEETRAGGPFPAMLSFDLLVHCVLVQSALPPFLTDALLDRPRALRVIADVTCDAGSPWNLLPIYREGTTLEAPVRRLRSAPTSLDLIAIDHLPSLLPRESSEDFAEQLLPVLRELLLHGGSPTWARAEALFHQRAGQPATPST
jgi:saccharopine dehydrogenase (NAD+, L-lysine-forming)